MFPTLGKFVWVVLVVVMKVKFQWESVTTLEYISEHKVHNYK